MMQKPHTFRDLWLVVDIAKINDPLFDSWYHNKGKGILFRILYPPKRSHDLPTLAGL